MHGTMALPHDAPRRGVAAAECTYTKPVDDVWDDIVVAASSAEASSPPSDQEGGSDSAGFESDGSALGGDGEQGMVPPTVSGEPWGQAHMGGGGLGRVEG